jgi:hypothetical protein
LFQAALIARDEVVVVHAARAAAREASVTSDLERVRAAATDSLEGAVVTVTRRGAVGEPVEVVVEYVSRTDLPLVGALLPDISLRSRAVMRVEA